MFAGEAINLYFKGSEQYDLASIDFNVYIYPDGDVTPSYLKYSKDDCTLQEDGSYLLSIGPSVTAKMPITTFTIEINDASNGLIYKQPGVFPIESSAAGIDIMESIEDEDRT